MSAHFCFFAFCMKLVCYSSLPLHAQPYAYVTCLNGDVVSQIDTTTQTIISTITVASDTNGLALMPGQNYLYVACASSPQPVVVIDLNVNRVIATIPTGLGNLFQLAITPNRAYAYVVAGYGQTGVCAIETSSNTVIATLVIAGTPVGVAITADSQYAYVLDNLNRKLCVIDIPTNTFVATVDCGLADKAVIIATVPSTSNAYAYATSSTAGLFVVDVATNTLIATITNTFTRVASSPNGSYLYLTSTTNEVVVMDPLTYAIIASISVGPNPESVAVSEDNNYVYVANGGSDTVTIISSATNSVIGTVTTAPFPLSVATPPAPVIPPPPPPPPPSTHRVFPGTNPGGTNPGNSSPGILDHYNTPGRG